ncbi:MAG: hypothetical protein AABX14_03310 [Candidatus Aenigmatarchaeota archaeon]
MKLFGRYLVSAEEASLRDHPKYESLVRPGKTYISQCFGEVHSLGISGDSMLYVLVSALDDLSRVCDALLEGSSTHRLTVTNVADDSIPEDLRKEYEKATWLPRHVESLAATGIHS